MINEEYKQYLGGKKEAEVSFVSRDMVECQIPSMKDRQEADSPKNEGESLLKFGQYEGLIEELSQSKEKTNNDEPSFPAIKLQEAVEIIQDNAISEPFRPDKVYVEPPEASTLTDEEDGNAPCVIFGSPTFLTYSSFLLVKGSRQRKWKRVDLLGVSDKRGGGGDEEGVRGRRTRSGRAVTNQFSQLCLTDPPTARPSLPVTVSGDSLSPPVSVSSSPTSRPQDSLFEGKEDNETIFSFRTPKRQDGMVKKASEIIRTMEFTPTRQRAQPSPRRKPDQALYSARRRGGAGDRRETREEEESGGGGGGGGGGGRTGRGRELYDPSHSSQHIKTPYNLRTTLRKRLVEEASKQELDQLLEDSGSDFIPSSSDSESEEERSRSSSGSESEDTRPLSERVRSGSTLPSLTATSQKELLAKRKATHLKDYIFQSEEYFDRQYSKIMTSNNSLKKLKTPKLAPSKLASILKKLDLKHIEAFHNLESVLDIAFKQWMFAFSEGFNVMLYGLGSKLHIFEKFHETWLQSCFVAHIKGYFPDNSLKEILSDIASTYFHLTTVPTQPHEIVEEIKRQLDSDYVPSLFVILPNLDGKFLQNDKNQSLISQLVSHPKAHLLASVDHINSPLLWDQSKLSSFNFVWEDATTFMAYTEETSYEGSLMVQRSGGLALSALTNIFSSLNINSRKVFNILLTHHLDNNGPKYRGLGFSELYRECRAGFVVSSDLALRSLLTEFVDHQLVRWQKETDHILITIDPSVLADFKSQADHLFD